MSTPKNDPSKLTCTQIEEFLADEKKATKEYSDLGLLELSDDEKHHAEFMQQQWEIKKCVPQSAIKEKIRHFIVMHPKPTDVEIHEFAIRQNISPHKVEETIYEMLSEFLKK